MRKRHSILLGVFLMLGTAATWGGSNTLSAHGQLAVAANPAPTVQATPRPPDCDMTISATYMLIDDPAALAWVSHQVITGTVVEQLPPVWVYPDPQGAPGWRKIYTDYVVRIDQRLRGIPSGTVRVRRAGGTLDGCTQQNPSEPALAVGDRRLLFLHEFSVPNAPAGAYGVIGGPQGYWGLTTEGTVTTAMPGYQRFNGLPVSQVAGQLRAALAGAPPAGTPRDLLVPLDRAPVLPIR